MTLDFPESIKGASRTCSDYSTVDAATCIYISFIWAYTPTGHITVNQRSFNIDSTVLLAGLLPDTKLFTLRHALLLDTRLDIDYFKNV